MKEELLTTEMMWSNNVGNEILLKDVLDKLLEIIYLYKESRHYSCLPGEAENSDTVRKYFESRFSDISGTLYPNSYIPYKVKLRVEKIVGEVRHFVTVSAGAEGLVKRFFSVNPNLLFYTGVSDFKEEYFSELRRQDEKCLKYDEDDFFMMELAYALRILFYNALSDDGIIVVGVGDAGNHVINGMMDREMDGIKYIGVNTDRQALLQCKAPILLEIGEKAAEKSEKEIITALKGADIVFIVCGMGGVTGTDAAPAVAKLAKAMGLLTVGVVTTPFSAEEKEKQTCAQRGIERIREYADTMIVFSGDELLGDESRQAILPDDFRKMSNASRQAIETILDLVNTPDIINLDLADIEWILKPKGTAYTCAGEGFGEEKGPDAMRKALESLPPKTSLKDAAYAIVRISGDITLNDASNATDYLKKLSGDKISVLFGATYDNSIADRCAVTVIIKFVESTE